MLIQATNHTLNVGYEMRLAQKYGKDTAAFKEAAAAVDKVTISDAGRAMNAAVSEAVDPGHELMGVKPGENWALKPLPMLSYAEASRRAEAGLKEAMRQLGMPADAQVSLTFNGDGTISVEGGGGKGAELEAMVNENRDLRNMLVMASNAAYMERIQAASQQVYAAVDADPGKYERAYAWLIGATQRINAMGFQFDFSGGALSGSFLSGGQKLGLTENMEVFRG